ncbi:hypothetical protein TDB9533_00813 [Thalassocella blandensis]|nr:hypothetical protein TDB9533_00813 [Thalassocella blandensis]
MKDNKDKDTIDLFTGRKTAGRPRKYKNDAEKMRVYRLRKKLREASL